VSGQKPKTKSWYGPCGSLVTDTEIPGVSYDIGKDDSDFYGARFFIGESMSVSAAKTISEALGLDYQGEVK